VSDAVVLRGSAAHAQACGPIASHTRNCQFRK